MNFDYGNKFDSDGKWERALNAAVENQENVANLLIDTTQVDKVKALMKKAQQAYIELIGAEEVCTRHHIIEGLETMSDEDITDWSNKSDMLVAVWNEKRIAFHKANNKVKHIL